MNFSPRPARVALRTRPRPYCCYCKRPLAPMHPETGLSQTWDHVLAESRGGTRKVPCCRTCNGLKGDLPTDDWFWFISCHTRWWKLFPNNETVAAVCRQERVRRAYAGERQLGRGTR